MILIAAPREDSASVNIAERLLEQGFREVGEGFYELRGAMLKFVDEDGVYIRNIDGSKFKELIILSRHESRKEAPMLSLHAPGNLSSEALLGGNPREVALSNPRRMKSILSSLARQRNSDLGYSVCMEATHHGPTSLGVPTTFVEIGSTEREWKDEEAGRIVAKAVIDSLEAESPDPPAIGLGGDHYAYRLTDACLKRKFALGHIITKYQLGRVDDSLIRSTLRMSAPPCKHALIDGEGMRGKVERRLSAILEEERVEAVRI